MPLCDADAVVRYAGLSDPDWDLLEALVQRASAAIEDYCGCAFAAAQHDELHDIRSGQSEVALRHYPVTALAELRDGVTATSPGRVLGPDEYLLDADTGLLRLRDDCFTPGRAAVRVVYTAGPEAPPGPVVQAAVMLAADWYRNRPDGRAVREDYDGYSAAYAAEAIPPRVARLLDPYRRRRLA